MGRILVVEEPSAMDQFGDPKAQWRLEGAEMGLDEDRR